MHKPKTSGLSYSLLFLTPSALASKYIPNMSHHSIEYCSSSTYICPLSTCNSHLEKSFEIWIWLLQGLHILLLTTAGNSSWDMAPALLLNSLQLFRPAGHLCGTSTCQGSSCLRCPCLLFSSLSVALSGLHWLLPTLQDSAQVSPLREVFSSHLI